MNNLTKKEKTELGFSIFLLFLAMGTGSLISSLFMLIAAIVIFPIGPLRKKLDELKTSKSVLISISVICVIISLIISPITQQTKVELPDNVQAILSITETTTESSKDKGVKEAQTLDESITDLSSIPKYSGKPYVEINNNQPKFSKNELSAKGYEKYSELDSLGRCGPAIASCGKEIMPKKDEERGSISKIKPTGWKQGKYDNVDNKYLYNRCHLIGWQLSAENANERNLITGTRYMNVEGMLPFENMIADYIDETENHVAYRVTPIFEGKNLLASGVQLEAYSVEDNGKGICFNVYCYNVQPDVEIDYATGANTEKQ